MELKTMKILNLQIILSIALLSLLSAFPARAQKVESSPEIVASGGTFTLEKTVTAGGGNRMSQAAFDQSGTAGQTVAGNRSTGGQFTLYPGFWTPENLAPTAANVVVGGRILTANGAGIRNVQITITFPSGEIRSTASTSFGYYRFSDIPAGQFYVISVAAKKYTFPEPTQIRQVQDDLTDVDFTAAEIQSVTAEKIPS